jgi:hypothetical protein
VEVRAGDGVDECGGAGTNGGWQEGEERPGRGGTSLGCTFVHGISGGAQRF